ncbi:MAG: hypothetical protein ACYTBP_12745 [Planctomycetota bacterium]
MSNVTKILIILLTVASIFLCATVVTYVSLAGNYKEKYEKSENDRKALVRVKQDALRDFEAKSQKFKAAEDALNMRLTKLTNEISALKVDLDNAKRQNENLSREASSWKAIVADFGKTTDENSSLLKNTMQKLTQIEAERAKLVKDLDETSQEVLEKMAVIETIEAEKKRILEDKADLEQKLNAFLHGQGKTVGTLMPVTPLVDRAQPVTPPADIDLKGRITVVDMVNSMVSISIGKADGVAKGMKFYVIRGDDFICEISIIEVETEEAVGVIKLAQDNPKVGDIVTSNLD